MKAIQYTIRNVPPSLDKQLRKRAHITGKSLNRIIVEDLADKSGLSADKTAPQTMAQSLSWFIGSGAADDETVRILAAEDKRQKRQMAKKHATGA